MATFSFCVKGLKQLSNLYNVNKNGGKDLFIYLFWDTRIFYNPA